MSERWLPVVGYEERYEVSDHGRVRSLDRWVQTRGYKSVKPYKTWTKGRLLTPDVTESGHFLVGLGGGVERRRRYLHVMILEAFVGPNPGNMEGRHLNGDPSCNLLKNLCWASRARNLMDRKWHAGTTRYKLRPDDVREARKLLASGVRQKDVAILFGVTGCTIKAMQVGRTHSDVV